jgi:hypothetical protein
MTERVREGIIGRSGRHGADPFVRADRREAP